MRPQYVLRSNAATEPSTARRVDIGPMLEKKFHIATRTTMSLSADGMYGTPEGDHDATVSRHQQRGCRVSRTVTVTSSVMYSTVR